MKRVLTAITLPVVLAGAAHAGDLYRDGKIDYFGLARYPEGGELVDGVELYQVSESGGAADKYGRRVVRWWPRKGVDFIEIKDGMLPPREWTFKADPLDEGAGGLKGEPTIVEHEKQILDQSPNNWFQRRFRGYLHPPADGDYVFKISADTMGFFYVSTDDKPENKKLVCRLTKASKSLQWDLCPEQKSGSIPLKKGRKYYYEVIHSETDRKDHIAAAWQSDAMEEALLGGPCVSTLKGEPGKVIEERWGTPPGTGVRAHDLPRSFKAQLLGFDGIGNRYGDPFQDGEDFVEPTTILRMPDGTMRSFEDGTFCQTDREFILKEYLEAMERVKAGLDKTVCKVQPGTIRGYPNNAEVGEPGTMRVETEHFVVPSGSQGKSAWVNTDDPEKSARFRQCATNMLEDFHAYLEYGGHLMPYWDRKEQYKFEVHVGGTIADGFRSVGGGGMGGYGGAGVALSSRPGGFSHEYAHGFSIQWKAHSGEILPTANNVICGGDAGLCEMNVERPFRNPIHGTYVTVLFYRMVGFDPNWGMCAPLALPKSVAESSFFQTLARVGQQRGLFKDGMCGVGDMVGDYGARQAEFDTQNQEALRQQWFAVARNYLEPVDKEQGIYRIPWDEAPEPFGVNIVRLVPDKGASVIDVDFQGYHDPAVYSDWRACIVAVDKDGRARYSDLWNKDGMHMERRDGDQRYWLTVAATPRAQLGSLYQGHFAARYPWQVTLRGATPGAPQRTRADLNDVYGVYGHGDRMKGGAILPVAPNTEADKRFVVEARTVGAEMRKRVDNRAAGELEKVFAHWVLDNLEEALGSAEGAPHPNGGGWVAATAQVAPTAYIGPHAAVLERAKVLDQAVVEDGAVIRDSAIISDHARVSGQAVIGDGARLDGHKRAWFPLGLAADEEPPELTTRLNEDLDEYGLWANYAMDQAEAMVLEDWYRGTDSDREFFCSVLNGYLYGKPAFVVDGEHRGFAFDGKAQYAELNRRIADLAEITVDMTVKRLGDGGQTLLDFGSNMDNRFTLASGGKDGTLAFTAVVDGKTVASLSSPQPLPRERWTRVRLELDGDKAALWMDDAKVAETAAAFRPCQVFKPGLAQRNFIATARDLSAGFKGVFDDVVVYHRVHGNAFAKLPRPVISPPRRPAAGFAARVRRTMDVSAYEQQDRAGKLSGPMMEAIGGKGSRAAMRLYQLQHRSQEWPAAVARAAEIDKLKAEYTQRFQKESGECKEARELAAQIAEIDKKLALQQKKLPESGKKKSAKTASAPSAPPSAEIVELDKRSTQLKAKIAEVEKRIKQAEGEAKAEVAAMPESKAEQAEIARLKEQIAPLKAPADAVLEKALKDDGQQAMAEAATKEAQKYTTGYWRAVSSVNGALGGWWGQHVKAIKERLKTQDETYGKWAALTQKLGETEARRRYRDETFLMQHAGRADLLDGADVLRQELADVAEQRKAAEPPKAEPPPVSKEDAALQSELSALQQEKDRLRTRLREITGRYVEEKMREVGALDMDKERKSVLAEGRRKAMLRYYQEDVAAWSTLRSAFHGWFNGPYAPYVNRYCAKLVGTPRIRGELAMAEKIAASYAPENWKTRVDQWDWRTAWEKNDNDSLKELPLTRKWLERVKTDN